MTNITNKLDIVISPIVLKELLEFIDPDYPNMDELMRELVQEIIDGAKNFIERYAQSYFLAAEPIHEFVGLEYRDPKDPSYKEETRYRMTCNGTTVGVFSQTEVPIDDMYEIRRCIADSQFPEFQ